MQLMATMNCYQDFLEMSKHFDISDLHTQHVTLERNCRTRTNAITHNCLVTLDQKLTFVRQINLLCGSCYYQLRQLRVVSLSPAAASTLAHAFVVYRLDYCSAIYEGLPTCRFKCLDRVLRTAARLVGRIPRFGRVSGYMRDHLHWLPYPQCLPHLCVGSALHRGTSPILSPGTLLLHCYYSASYHYVLLPRRSCWSPERGLLSDSAEPSL